MCTDTAALSIAVDGKKVLIGLEVPGADIVGFEHEPSTPEQKAAIPNAKAKLANGLALFKPEEKAHCELEQVKVSLEAGHEEEHEHGAPAPAAAPAQAAAPARHRHRPRDRRLLRPQSLKKPDITPSSTPNTS